MHVFSYKQLYLTFKSNIEKDHFCKDLSQKEEELQRTRELLEKEKFEKEQKQEEIGILGVQIVQLETKIRVRISFLV